MAEEKLDRTPVEPYGMECCAADGCQTCFRVEYDREVTDPETGETRTERYYVSAAEEMTEHLKTCEPYQAKLAAEQKAAEDAAAAEAEKPVAKPMVVTPLVDEAGTVIGVSFTDAEGKQQFRLIS